MSIFEQTVFGNSLDQWLLAAGIALVGTIILDVAAAFNTGKARAFVARCDTFDHLITMSSP